MGRPRMTDEQKAEAKRNREEKKTTSPKPEVVRPARSVEATKALAESEETPLSQEEALKLMETWKDQSLKQNKGSTAVEY